MEEDSKWYVDMNKEIFLKYPKQNQLGKMIQEQ